MQYEEVERANVVGLPFCVARATLLTSWRTVKSSMQLTVLTRCVLVSLVLSLALHATAKSTTAGSADKLKSQLEDAATTKVTTRIQGGNSDERSQSHKGGEVYDETVGEDGNEQGDDGEPRLRSISFFRPFSLQPLSQLRVETDGEVSSLILLQGKK